MVEIVRNGLELEAESDHKRKRRALLFSCSGIVLEYFDVMLFIHLGAVMMG